MTAEVEFTWRQPRRHFEQSEAIQFIYSFQMHYYRLDCHVASLLAMTSRSPRPMNCNRFHAIALVTVAPSLINYATYNIMVFVNIFNMCIVVSCEL